MKKFILSNVFIATAIMFILLFSVMSNHAFASNEWTVQTGSGQHNWSAIASSADGTKLVATEQGLYVYVSSDSGATWSEKVIDGSVHNWSSIKSSEDGTKLAAYDGGGYIYTSEDSGETWTKRYGLEIDGPKDWRGITLSNDGMKLAIVDGSDGDPADGGYIWTSTEGADGDWARKITAGSGNYWLSITASVDGTKLVASNQDGYVYISNDSGATWSTSTSSGQHAWTSITSSSDGSKLAAIVNGGYVYISTDSGATWSTSTSSGQHAWTSITSSSDGSKLAVVDHNNGYVYTYYIFKYKYSTIN